MAVMPAEENSVADREVVLGRVSGLFGIKGWVKVHSYTEPRESLLDFIRWSLLSDGKRRSVTVIESRKQGRSLVARFEGIEDRDTAAELVGAEIRVARNCLPQPPGDQYYWTDLEGLQVVHRDGRLLGRVAYLLATGANDVLVVQGEKEFLVPFVMDKVILDVDTTNGVISVDWEWD